MTRLLAALLLAVGLLTGGCGTLVQRDTAQMSAQQKLTAHLSDAVAAGYVAVTQARVLNRELLADRLIGSVTAAGVQRHLDDARAALDVGRSALGAAPDLAAAQSALERYAAAIGAARGLLANVRPKP